MKIFKNADIEKRIKHSLNPVFLSLCPSYTEIHTGDGESESAKEAAAHN